MKHTILSLLRDKNTKMSAFRDAAERLATLLSVEAAQEVKTSPHEVETPLGKAHGKKLAHEIVLLPILRAGLSMLHPFLKMFPESRVGFLGVKRDEETALPHHYYTNLPAFSSNQFYIILDPMIATGGSGKVAIEMLKDRGVHEDQILYVGMVGASEGIAQLKQAAPKMKILCAEVDKELNSKKYIVPGLGDFGDRYFGT